MGTTSHRIATVAYEEHRTAVVELLDRCRSLASSGPAPERTNWGHVGTIDEARHLLEEALAALAALADGHAVR